MEVYHNIANYATFGGDARDKTADDPAPHPGDDSQVFAGMSAAERYELDTFGILHLRGVLAPGELAAAQAAFDRLQADPSLMAPLGDFPFAAEGALEGLAAHPRLLPVLLELCGGAPHLVSGGTIATPPFTTPSDGSAPGKPLGSGQLHCQREYDHTHARYTAEAPGRCRADNLVVFPYLDTCEAGDGGLLFLPGSHRSQFSRPRTLFGPFGRHEEEWAAKDWSRSRGSSPESRSPLWHDVPEGLANLCPSAGDFIVMPEATCHGILPWRNREHGRRILSLRFKTGGAFEAHRAHYPSKPTQEVLARLSRPTLALVTGEAEALHAMCGDSFHPAPDPGAALPQSAAWQRRCWRYGAAPTAVDDEPWPEMGEFSKLANDAVYGGVVKDCVPELDSGRAGNSPWGPVKAAGTNVLVNTTTDLSAQDDDAAFAMTAEQRYLFDTQGFVRAAWHVFRSLVARSLANTKYCLQLVLRGVLSEAELAAARGAFERTLATATVPPPGGVRDPTAGPARSNVDGKPIREPDLELLATHPKLLPILAELGQGAPQLTAMTMVYHPPHSGPPLTTEMYGQIHSHREGSPAGSGRICYEVREPGRVGTDDINVFPYFTSTQPGDGGLAVLPGKSHALRCLFAFFPAHSE